MNARHKKTTGLTVALSREDRRELKLAARNLTQLERGERGVVSTGEVLRRGGLRYAREINAAAAQAQQPAA